MPNLNKHDLILFKSKEFKGFQEFLERNYQFKIVSSEYPSYISFTSRKAILYTDKGEYFLKEKPIYSSDKVSRDKSASFQSYASSQLGIVPQILTTTDNKQFVMWKKRYYFLTKYMKGRIFNGSDQDVTSMLNALMKLQEVGREFANRKDVSASILKTIESYEVAQLIPLIEKYINSAKDNVIYQRITKCLASLKLEYLSLSKKEYIMSHSDFIVFNLIFDKGKVVAINDFDNAKILPSLHDLAEFLVSATLLNYIGSVTNMKLPVLLEPQSSKFNLIIKTYLQEFNLDKDDFALLGIIAEIVWLWTLCLAVLKEDYKILDLEEAVETIEKRKLSDLIKSTALQLSK